MAAKRLGSVLTNVTGTSGQLLRVKSDESGFEFYTPTGLPAYTITNDTTQRTVDADVTTIDTLADLVSTLIKDITTMVGGPVAFQWSSSEQVYPFEKASDGSVLYCKEVNLGAGPNNGYKDVAHNIASFVPGKMHRYSCFASAGGASNGLTVPRQYPGVGASTLDIVFMSTVIEIASGGDTTSLTWIVKMIYAK